MSYLYFKNIAGGRLSDMQMANISNCEAIGEVLAHGTTRTTQTGAILGIGIVGPVASIANGNWDLQSIQESAYYYGWKGALIGLVLGLVLLVARIALLDKAGIKDRAYRLRRNRYQCFVDSLSLYGTIAGLGAALCLGIELAKGALFGFAGGCCFAAFVNIVFYKPSPKKPE